MSIFQTNVTPEGVELRLHKQTGFLGRSTTTLPWPQWLEEAPAASRVALSRLSDWAIDGVVVIRGQSVLIPHERVAALTEPQSWDAQCAPTSRAFGP